MRTSLILVIFATGLAAPAARETTPSRPGDRMLARYFSAETARLAEASLAEIETLEAWIVRRRQYRLELLEMLGLDPLPERSDLKPVVTGFADHPEFTVEKLHFQSLPGLYVTANLYIPKGLEKAAPAVLYLCGHGRAEKDGVSFGNKTSYQRHPAWFARHGYVAMAIDTIQLGEIMGTHHGTYRKKMWWWNARGYTPAGVETWNAMRALDYLERRPEVDPERIGVTGRSGGGAYSWWIAALDERIKVAVPVAGITDLQNHIVDGVIEGHCDCMFMVNTYRWDFAQVAALVAPRPLLISNSDKDSIFPLDGVVRVHAKVKKIYELYGAADKLGLQITEGDHGDTQVLRVHAFQWMNRHLKDENPLIERPAVQFFDPAELKVFDSLPEDEIVTRIEETFVSKAPAPSPPNNETEWRVQRDKWMTSLREKSFAGWPSEAQAPGIRQSAAIREINSVINGGRRLTVYEFDSQPGVRLEFYLVRPDARAEAVRLDLRLVDEAEGPRFLESVVRPMREAAAGREIADSDPIWEWYREVADGLDSGEAAVYFAPRGIGSTMWNPDEREATHIRRRFALLGQTVDGMRVWDIRRAIEAVRALEDLEVERVTIGARGPMAVNALYASLFVPALAALDLTDLPATHREGPIYLNVLKFMDVPEALAMAARRTAITLHDPAPGVADFAEAVTDRLGGREARLNVYHTGETKP